MASTAGIYRFIILLIIVSAASAYIDVKFTKTLNVGTLTSDTYTKFLKDLRQTLAKTYSASVPVLTVYNQQTPEGFDVILTAGATTTTARFRSDNLYLVGFQTGAREWYEFGKIKNNPPRLIQGSQLLDFDGDYPELESIAGKVTSMVINQKKLAAAVGFLAVSQNKGDRAGAVIVVIQMISEAARFVDVSGHFASNLVNGAKLPEWMRSDLENNWALMSYQVLKPAADPCYKFKPQTINGKRLDTVPALRAYFGILYRDADTLLPPSGPPCKSLRDEMASFGPMMVPQA